MTTIETAKKPLSSIDNNIIKVFHLISYHRENPIIMGTNKYKNLRYPSDFDLYEVIHEGNNKEEFIEESINIFKQIIHNIKADDNLYFIDFKTELRNGNKLRWKPHNIMNGYIKKKILLHDVLADTLNQLIKIDIIYYHNGLFTEFSNIFYITLAHHKKDVETTISSISDDARELIKKGKYYKTLKRLYSIAQIKQDKKLIKILFEVFNSDLGKLGQIISYLDSIVLVISRYDNAETINRIYESINLLKSMMIFPEIEINNTIFEKFNIILEQKSSKNIMLYCEKLIKSLNKILQPKAKAIYNKLQ